MKKVIIWIIIFAFVLSGLTVAVFSNNNSDPKSPAIRITPPAPKFSDTERQAELARRRAAVAAKMSDKSVLMLFSAEPKLYANDVDYVYRQENNLYYLTGLKQDGATLVIAKDGTTINEILFLPKRVALREAWEGKMYSREQATNISGLKTIVDSSERDAFFKALKEKQSFGSKDGAISIANSAATLYLLLPMAPQDQNGAREFRVENEFSKELSGYKVENAQHIFADLRHIKSPYELKILQHGIDITTEAQMRSMAMVGRAEWEYQVHAEVEYTFRRRNADFWGYPSIVGCGPNATTLHYVESQGEVRKGDLLLMDVGAEYDHYTADVTRTYPVNGKFSKEQAEIYQIVYDAQEAVAKATKPGATMQQLGQVARDTINEGLFKLGLVTDKSSRQVGYWYIHGLGHWLGMNVHDVGRYGVPLKAGMVFTNEPGIYIREDALDNLPKTPENLAFIEKVRPAFEKYKNIGVRIEDDMLVTETSVDWMTKNLPRSIADIEAFMAKASKEMTYTAVNKPSVLVNAFIGNSAIAFNGDVLSGVTRRRGLVFLPSRTRHSHVE
ncbi:MAG: aminopeptidase P family protein [Blastocatellia bacterium]